MALPPFGSERDAALLAKTRNEIVKSFSTGFQNGGLALIVTGVLEPAVEGVQAGYNPVWFFFGLIGLMLSPTVLGFLVSEN